MYLYPCTLWEIPILGGYNWVIIPQESLDGCSGGMTFFQQNADTTHTCCCRRACRMNVKVLKTTKVTKTLTETSVLGNNHHVIGRRSEDSKTTVP